MIPYGLSYIEEHFNNYINFAAERKNIVRDSRPVSQNTEAVSMRCILMELRGIEPLASTLRTSRSPS